MTLEDSIDYALTVGRGSALRQPDLARQLEPVTFHVRKILLKEVKNIEQPALGRGLDDDAGVCPHAMLLAIQPRNLLNYPKFGALRPPFDPVSPPKSRDPLVDRSLFAGSPTFMTFNQRKPIGHLTPPLHEISHLSQDQAKGRVIFAGWKVYTESELKGPGTLRQTHGGSLCK